MFSCFALPWRGAAAFATGTAVHFVNYCRLAASYIILYVEFYCNLFSARRPAWSDRHDDGSLPIGRRRRPLRRLRRRAGDARDTNRVKITILFAVSLLDMPTRPVSIQLLCDYLDRAYPYVYVASRTASLVATTTGTPTFSSSLVQ